MKFVAFLCLALVFTSFLITGCLGGGQAPAATPEPEGGATARAATAAPTARPTPTPKPEEPTPAPNYPPFDFEVKPSELSFEPCFDAKTYIKVKGAPQGASVAFSVNTTGVNAKEIIRMQEFTVGKSGETEDIPVAFSVDRCTGGQATVVMGANVCHNGLCNLKEIPLKLTVAANVTSCLCYEKSITPLSSG